MTCGLMMLTARAPRNEKTRAAHVAGRVAFQLISICLAYCADAIDVPAIEANLLVPKSIATGSWGMKMKSAGSCMRPPPPAMESMKPAIKAKTHSMLISITVHTRPLKGYGPEFRCLVAHGQTFCID